VLHEAAGAAYGFASAAANSNNWVADECFTHLAVGTRENKAHQSFERQFRSIDFKIQRQALHREDIRDLVELTTKRMDIYHIVGTLLLTFCITWYTDNAILRGDNLPIWYADLFLISNFAAVGYLILSVWLAMYAAIASRSIGTRLLTSFARLSFPTRQEVEEVKVPLFVDFDGIKNKIMGRSQSSSEPVQKEYAPGGTWKAGQQDQLSEDDQQHFRRFLQELPRWLSYDTGSRLCMSYGMNQMLQALSYYVLGVIWTSSPMAAVTSFIAVKFLSILVLWIDVGAHHDENKDLLALFFLHFGPPFLAALLLYSTLDPTIIHSQAQHTHDSKYTTRVSLLGTLCFWGHAGWLWYMNSVTTKDGKKGNRFKASEFANVLEWVQCKAVREDFIQDVTAAYGKLRKEVVQVTQEESASGVVLPDGRECDRLREMSKILQAAREVLSKGDPHPSKDVELWHADQTLQHYEAWAKSPRILAGLEGLRHPMVQQRLTSREKRLVEDSYTAFLHLCQQHELGISVLVPSASTTGSSIFRRNGTLVAMDLPKEEHCIIEVAREGGGSAWIDTRSGEALCAPPSEHSRVTSCNILVNVSMPAWKREVETLSLQLPAAPSDEDEASSAPAVQYPQTFQTDGGPKAGKWTGSLKTEVVAPPDDLPMRLIWYFTMGTVVWWCIAGMLHAIIVFSDEEDYYERLAGRNATSLIEFDANSPQLVNVQWPEPVGLFKVEALHCNDHHLWVSNGFSLFSAEQAMSFIQQNETAQTTLSLGVLQEAKEGSDSGMICGVHHCDVLRRGASQTSQWSLDSLDSQANETTKINIPESWSHVTGLWTGCDGIQGRTCESAWVAGWDGTKVLVANLLRSKTMAEWDAHTRFALDPRIGLCPAGLEHCAHRLSKNKTYANVRSLRVDESGKSLAVLLDDGVLDVWDLEKGVVRGRLHLGDQYSSMCQSGSHLLLSKQTDSGPALVSVPLPVELMTVQSRFVDPVANATHANATQRSLRALQSSVGVTNTDLAKSSHVRAGGKTLHKHRFLGPALVQFRSFVGRGRIRYNERESAEGADDDGEWEQFELDGIRAEL